MAKGKVDGWKEGRLSAQVQNRTCTTIASTHGKFGNTILL